MIDVSMIPLNSNQLRTPVQVPRTALTVAQQQVIQAVWDNIQLARQSAEITKEDLSHLEDRFTSLIDQLNKAYFQITRDQKNGLEYLHHHLYDLATQASQF